MMLVRYCDDLSSCSVGRCVLHDRIKWGPKKAFIAQSIPADLLQIKTKLDSWYTGLMFWDAEIVLPSIHIQFDSWHTGLSLHGTVNGAMASETAEMERLPTAHIHKSMKALISECRRDDQP